MPCLVIALPATFDDSTRAARRQQQRRTIMMMAASSEKDDDLYAGYAANATQFEDWAASAAAEGEQYVCVHVMRGRCILIWLALAFCCVRMRAHARTS